MDDLEKWRKSIENYDSLEISNIDVIKISELFKNQRSKKRLEKEISKKLKTYQDTILPSIFQNIQPVRIILLGEPGAGKSSLLNVLHNCLQDPFERYENLAIPGRSEGLDDDEKITSSTLTIELKSIGESHSPRPIGIYDFIGIDILNENETKVISDIEKIVNGQFLLNEKNNFIFDIKKKILRRNFNSMLILYI